MTNTNETLTAPTLRISNAELAQIVEDAFDIDGNVEMKTGILIEMIIDVHADEPGFVDIVNPIYRPVLVAMIDLQRTQAPSPDDGIDDEIFGSDDETTNHVDPNELIAVGAPTLGLIRREDADALLTLSASWKLSPNGERTPLIETAEKTCVDLGLIEFDDDGGIHFITPESECWSLRVDDEGTTQTFDRSPAPVSAPVETFDSKGLLICLATLDDPREVVEDLISSFPLSVQENMVERLQTLDLESLSWGGAKMVRSILLGEVS